MSNLLMESLDIDILMVESVFLHCGAIFAVPSTNTGREEHNYEIQMNYAIEFTEILIMFGIKSGLWMVA